MRIPCRTAHAATEGRGGVFRTKAMPAARLGAERSPAPDHAAATARQPARHRRTDTCASTAMLGPARRQRTASTAKTPGTASSTVRTCYFVCLLGHMPREAAMRRTDRRGRDVLCQHVEVLTLLRHFTLYGPKGLRVASHNRRRPAGPSLVLPGYSASACSCDTWSTTAFSEPASVRSRMASYLRRVPARCGLMRCYL